MCLKPEVMKSIHVPTLYVNGSKINHVKQECYLGVDITEDGMDDAAIMKERNKLYARGNMLVRKFKHCTTEVKVKLFLAYCISFYCCALWSNFKARSLSHLHVAHNTMFKILMGAEKRSSASGLFVSFNVPNLKIIQRKMVFSLYTHVLSSQLCSLE